MLINLKGLYNFELLWIQENKNIENIKKYKTNTKIPKVSEIENNKLKYIVNKQNKLK